MLQPVDLSTIAFTEPNDDEDDEDASEQKPTAEVTSFQPSKTF